VKRYAMITTLAALAMVFVSVATVKADNGFQMFDLKAAVNMDWRDENRHELGMDHAGVDRGRPWARSPAGPTLAGW
jgi:hypothetical protein